MNVLSRDGSCLIIQVTQDELGLLGNALNEAFEVGFEDGEFQTRLGSTKAEALALHGQIIAAYDSLQL